MCGSDKESSVDNSSTHYTSSRFHRTKSYILQIFLPYSFLKNNWCEMRYCLTLYISYAFLPKNMTEHCGDKAYLYLLTDWKHQKEKIWAFLVIFFLSEHYQWSLSLGGTLISLPMLHLDTSIHLAKKKKSYVVLPDGVWKLSISLCTYSLYLHQFM